MLRRAAHGAVRLIPDWRRTIKTQELGPVRIRMRRHRHLLWEKFGQDDALTLGVFQRLIRPGDVVYDIGANIGIYTRFMVQRFGAGRVVAFEPMRENFELLQANIKLGGIADRVLAYPIALSDEEGEEELQVDDMTSGTAVLSSVSEGKASIGRQEFGLPPLSERVSVIRLDELVRQDDLPPPLMMKIDTEGAEVKVLRGAEKTLKAHQPRLAVALHAADKAIDTLLLLDSLGYHCFGFVKGEAGSDSLYRQIRAVDAEQLTNNNIVASCVMDEVSDEIAPLTLT